MARVSARRLPEPQRGRSRDLARRRELAAATAWAARSNAQRVPGARFEVRRGADPPDAEAIDGRGERVSIEVTELHRVPPPEVDARIEGIVVWSEEELLAAARAAVARKSARCATLPAGLRRRFDRRVLLMLLDERQRVDGALPAVLDRGCFDEVCLLQEREGRLRFAGER